MTENDKPRFALVLTALGEYYGRPLTDGVIGLYWQGLCGYDIAAIEKAVDAHIRNPDSGQFMPRVADLARMLGGTTQDAALLAWAKVDRAVRQVGTYASVVFDDPLIHRVLHDMGGWVPLGTKTEDEWPFVGREFENRYRGYRMRGEVPNYPAHLVGISEQQNAARGFHTDQPVMVGNAESARRVMLGGTDGPLLMFSRLGDLVPDLESAERGVRVIKRGEA